MNNMNQDELIQKRIEEKNKRIREYRSETQLSIQLGQAVNLAVEVILKEGHLTVIENKDEVLDYWVDYFMAYLDRKRKIVFDENEKMYNENPIPTVEQYESMTENQQKFYKDKQLENNRKKYAENKGKFIKRERCQEGCGMWVKVGEKCPRCDSSADGDPVSH